MGLQSASNSSGNAIAVKGLTVRFGSFEALRDVSFACPAGAMLAILGPNGGGKSTLVKALLGLVKPERGDIKVLGLDPENAPHRSISYVPQIKTVDRTFPALAIELVVSGMRQSWPSRISESERARAMDALEQAGIARAAEQPISSLSGGQLQRVYLARGLAREPKLILLDEPATGIDAPGQVELYRLLEEYRSASGATIAMVTHDWAVADHHASHVLLLNNAQVGFGKPADVLTDELLARVFGHTQHHHSMIVGHESHDHHHGGHHHHHGHDHD